GMAAQMGDTTPSPSRGRLATLKRPADLRRPDYQGWPLRSGILLADGSGNPPDIRISAAANIPAAPPPKNATNNHQPETIGSPLLLPLVSSPARRQALLRSYVWDQSSRLSWIKPSAD